ncbi:hypothetical protein [Kingella oralis]|uniref:hypothetical protein n=1 Tax=Kingella oralis TaxID=505 RepID=UPI0012DE6D85|nr:hypothetical protein [Kingella oralis]QMT41934.1 hypothetical protein H3L93_07745 [Kingella oralis]
MNLAKIPACAGMAAGGDIGRFTKISGCLKWRGDGSSPKCRINQAKPIIPQYVFQAALRKRNPANKPRLNC